MCQALKIYQVYLFIAPVLHSIYIYPYLPTFIQLWPININSKDPYRYLLSAKALPVAIHICASLWSHTCLSGKESMEHCGWMYPKNIRALKSSTCSHQCRSLWKISAVSAGMEDAWADTGYYDCKSSLSVSHISTIALLFLHQPIYMDNSIWEPFQDSIF